jgi:hypothetical protein
VLIFGIVLAVNPAADKDFNADDRPNTNTSIPAIIINLPFFSLISLLLKLKNIKKNNLRKKQ